MKLSWPSRKFTPKELDEKLAELSKDVKYIELDLSGKELESLPDLNEYVQLKDIKKLSLKRNDFTEIDPTKLPKDLHQLDISRNQISELCDLSNHHQLVKLDVSRNQIKVIEPSKLPPNIKRLYIQENLIRELCDLSKHRNLKKLVVFRNKLTTIVSSKIPENIEELVMWDNEISELCDLRNHQKLVKLDVSWNKITAIDPVTVPVNTKTINIQRNHVREVCDWSGHTQLESLDLRDNEIIRINPNNTNLSFLIINKFAEGFFSIENDYNHVRKCHLDTEHLKEPPQDVFNEGFTSIQEYLKRKEGYRDEPGHVRALQTGEITKLPHVTPTKTTSPQQDSEEMSEDREDIYPSTSTFVAKRGSSYKTQNEGPKDDGDTTHGRYMNECYSLADQQQVKIFKDSSFAVIPEASSTDWKPKFQGDGQEQRFGSDITNMCESNIPGPSIHFKHRYFQLQPMSKEKEDVCTRLTQEGQSITLTCDVSKPSSHDITSDESQGTTNLLEDDELTKILFRHITLENLVSCAGSLPVNSKPDMDPRELTRTFLHQFLERHHGPCNSVEILQSFIKYCEKYPCLSKCVSELKWLKCERSKDAAAEKATNVDDRPQKELQILCEECKLAVAKTTLELKPVIDVLSKVDKYFISRLGYTIISSTRSQEINSARSTDEALGLIRQAFHDSLDPEMMEEVLKVLKMEGTDKTLHAKEIEKYYHEQIDKHQQCMKCKASSSR